MENFHQLSIAEQLNSMLSVDNHVNNTGYKMIEKNIMSGSVDNLNQEQGNLEEKKYKGKEPADKVKVLTIPVDKSFLEGNLIDIPFISYFKTKEVATVVEYVWKDSSGIERKIEVHGSGKWGVPDEFCFDVLAALFRLHTKHHQKIEYDYDNEQWNVKKEIHFTFKELAKEMGYKSFGKRIFERIDTALEILNDTNIYNIANGGLYNAETKKYLKASKKESIGIISNYKSYRYSEIDENVKRIDYRKIKDKTSVEIEDFIYNNLRNSYFKIFNYKQFIKLHMGIAKKMFLLLNKWRAKRRKVFLKWTTLYQRIPLISNNEKENKPEKYMKRRIRDACKELIEVGYIKEVHENTIGIEFVFNIEKKSNELNNNGNKYDTIPDILKALKELKLDYNIISEILIKVPIDKLKATLISIENKTTEEKQEVIMSLK